MGDKKITTRTVKGTDEKVLHHPDGTQHLVPRRSLAAALAQTEDQARAADAALTAARLEAVEGKRESLSAGDSVPDDKRAI